MEITPVIAVGTRFFDDRQGADAVNIIVFVDTALRLTNKGPVIVAVDTKRDKSDACNRLTYSFPNQPRLHIIPTTWGEREFTKPMNELLSYAMRIGAAHFVSLSVEARIYELKDLLNHMDDDTLCGGARLDGHVFNPGENQLNGRTVPWNTCRMHNLAHYRMGYPLIGDMPTDPKNSGVEETTADALALMINPNLKIKLVEVKGIDWEVDFGGNETRAAIHKAKMASKAERPAAQLALVGGNLLKAAQNATVLHIPLQ